MIAYFRSALFLVWFAVVSTVVHIVCLPLLLLPGRFTCEAARIWARLVLLGLDWFAGLGVQNFTARSRTVRFSSPQSISAPGKPSL